jgi:hypothetical protein
VAPEVAGSNPVIHPNTKNPLQISATPAFNGPIVHGMARGYPCRIDPNGAGHALRSTASHAIAQVDYSGAETSRLKEFEIPS